LAVENIGGQLNAYTSRENTSYSMTVFNNQISKGLEILGSMLVKSTYRNEHLEAERDTIFRELLETHKQQMETLVEYSHFGVSFEN
jgi:predicted Zn-dependent peptidase